MLAPFTGKKLSCPLYSGAASRVHPSQGRMLSALISSGAPVTGPDTVRLYSSGAAGTFSGRDTFLPTMLRCCWK